ncbi:kappa-type opioid receptor-like [Anneissia japonica]|uniref:kappa-type opioid receptor-like n=1 Tax=Anneissia japonica TaxID=1529436 RepID=UPI0014257738|nr:kappa-type opioid receptor-like [Anneissia japonica]
MTANNFNVSTSEASEEIAVTLIIVLCINVCVSAIGICANLTVIIVFINCKIYRSSFTYLLVFQQSMIDMIANCFYFILFCVYPVAAWKNNDIYCKLIMPLFQFVLSASTLNLLLIAVERYIAVVQPLKYWIRGNNKRSMSPQLCLPFVAAFIITFQFVFIYEGSDSYLCSISYKHRSFKILSGISIFLLNLVCPICVMTFCYCRVYVTLRTQSKIRAELTNNLQKYTTTTTTRCNDNNVQDFEINKLPLQFCQIDKNQRNFIDTMLINTLIYIFCNSPVIIMFLVYTICDCFDFMPSIFSYIFTILGVIGTAANPFVYAYKFNDYRDGLSKTFCRQS